MLATSPTPVISSRVSRFLTVLSKSIAENCKTNSQQHAQCEADGKVASRFRNYRAGGKRRVLLDDNASIGLVTFRRSLQFAYHDDKLVGQCVGNVACPDG